LDIKLGVGGISVKLRVSDDKIRVGVGLGYGYAFTVARSGLVKTTIRTAPERRETFGSWDADDIVRGGRP
jgi:hypothetical protein